MCVRCIDAFSRLLLLVYEMTNAGRVDMSDFQLLKVLGTGGRSMFDGPARSALVTRSTCLAYGKVFLVRKMTGADLGKLYAMKVLKKAAILQKAKTAEHIKTERQVLEAIRQIPFLVSCFPKRCSSSSRHGFVRFCLSHLLERCAAHLDYVSGGELFTHLNKRQHFSERDARIYIAELTLALGQLHRVRPARRRVHDIERAGLVSSSASSIETSNSRIFFWTAKVTLYWLTLD
jgi:serine/threonine protein kinase